jgi:putative RecB family exonuclease
MRRHSLPRSTSASQLSCYVSCPRKFYLQYSAQVEPEFRSTALALGSALHSAVGWWFEEKLAGRTPTLEGADRIFVSDLLAECSLGNIRWKDATPESLESDGLRYLRVYLERFGDLAVRAVEEPFNIELVHPETGELVSERNLKGYIDLVLEDERIIELKTSRSAWSDLELIRHLQVGALAAVGNALHGGPADVEVHAILKQKRQPRVEVYAISRGEPATRWWFEAVRAIEGAIADGHFAPNPTPRCGECEYEKACAAWVTEPMQLARSVEPLEDRKPHLLALA